MPLASLAAYEELAARVHSHLCAGQILGLRMALRGLRLLGIEDPTGVGRQRLVVFVEIDRCATDAISLVTGCRLGKRALKFRDFGKAAATFCDLASGRAVRLAARESARQRAGGPAEQLAAYREMPDDELFTAEWVRVPMPPEDLPGFRAPRVVCEACGESVSFCREVVRDGRTLCRACAGERFYEPL